VSSSNLIRAGGLATMLAGILLIVTGIAFMGPLGLADTAEEFTTGGNALMVWLSVVGLVLLQIGLLKAVVNAHSRSNSCASIPACRRMLRSIPTATSRCRGTMAVLVPRSDRQANFT
jgi:hypothetical protein